MKITDEQYEAFCETIYNIRVTLSKLEHKIGNVPMTIRFMRAVNQLCSDLSQMYFEETKGKEEKDLDRKIASVFKK